MAGRSGRLTYASAQSDLEDVRQGVAEQAEFRRWQAERTADTSGDSSAPTPAEVDAAELMATRAERCRAKRRENGRLLPQGRALARMDRGRR